METNYELKHKCLLVPLRAVLLVIAMVMVGFTTYAQQGKAVKVANDEQLIEAIENPSIGTIELAPGYYAFLNVQATEGTKVVKYLGGNGNRSSSGCTYTITGANFCYRPTDLYYPEVGDPIPGWSYGEVVANVVNTTCLSFPVPCCPLDGSGVWTNTLKPAGASDPIIVNPSFYTSDVYVDKPGQYKFKYTWDPAVNPALTEFAEVETEYNFFGPAELTLDAPDVCGLITYLDFVFEPGFAIPPDDFVLQWTIDFFPYDNPIPFAGPLATDHNWEFTAPTCGIAIIKVVYVSELPDCSTEAWVEVEFSCDPVADAGPDVNVCDALCYYSLHGSTGLYTFSPSHAWSWVQIGGTGDGVLVFDNQFDSITGVCATDPLCAYGEYEVQFQVQNGLCYDEDEMFLRFYEDPTANAGPDQYLCDDFSFSLAAVPYVYCGVEGENYWSVSYWEVFSQADPAAIITFDPDIYDPNAVVTISSTAECPYGEYEFKWVEINSKGITMGGCEDDDNVVVTIFETPVIDAGADMVFCETFAFSLYGVGDTPCYTMTAVVYSWEKTEWPGNCLIEFVESDDLQPSVYITGCGDVCPYGEYIFTLTQSNGYYDGGQNFVAVCETSDDVSVWIFEEPIANAGPDQHICDNFAFTLGAVPYPFCGEEDVDYFTWGVWGVVSGAGGDVSFVDINDPQSGVSINADAVPCPYYGDYVFMWTEYNGFINDAGVFEGCMDVDYVTITVYPTPEPDAGDDAAYCETSINGQGNFMFALVGTDDVECIGDLAYTFFWSVVSQPDLCTVTFTPDVLNPMVTIFDCTTCPYGEYVFRLTQQNGYFDDAGAFIMICEGVDDVVVTIYEQPVDVYAGPDMLLCNDFAFSLTATGYDYCGDFGVNYNNWYSWTLISSPAECVVTITNGDTEIASVTIEDCVGECAFGEYVFRFTERNGDEEVFCEDWDEVTVTIFEMPVADAGEDVFACVDILYSPYCYSMTATLDFCYSMYGEWTKSCGPGEVMFSDVNSPVSEACFEEPGRYIFTWTVWNAAEGCEASDEVLFDLLEQPTAIGENDYLAAPCDELCYSFLDAGIVKYEYFGTEAGECPNYWDMAHWSLIMGPDGTDPLQVTFADDTDPATEFCVSWYGGYTFRWNEVNKPADKDYFCESFFDVYVEFVETPVPFAGDHVSICGNCYTLQGELYEYLPLPNQHLNDFFYWEVLPDNPCVATISDIYALQPEVCIPHDDLYACYGTYGFVLHESNGECYGSDTVYICFAEIPNDVAISFWNDPNYCGPWEEENQIDFIYNGCLQPDEVLEVCAEGWTHIGIGSWWGECIPGFDWSNPAFYGWTFEWTLISPSGTMATSQAGYYDFEWGQWEYPWINIYWGECCDTARLYLTITTGLGDCGIACENTMEYKFYVHHQPCVEIEGPDVSEVGLLTTYCNVCPEDFDTDCLLYNWTAEHCGEIVSGQGTDCIEVLWTDYNVNGGWGEITLTVFDTCTGCCNYDEMMVKIYPTGTLGEATLSGYVYYQNNFLTPLNGVEVQLWNGGIPVMSTLSFTDVEGGNGVGYYEFTGINGITPFGVTASYDAPWYGANATDALAVELRVINSLPGGFFVNQPLQEEAMDVNNISAITATDALWIKQRAINMVSYFPAGDWAFEPGMTTIAGTYNIMTLNMGDANRSNIPNSTKSAPAIALVNDGTMNVVNGQVFELPIRIANADQFGAITLNLEYNAELLEVVEVVSMEGMLDNVANGNVSIAWSNVNPMVLAENDVVMTLKVKAIGEISATESLFSIGMNSEFADQSAAVIEPVTLKTFGITTEPAAADYFLSSNRPNPFNNSTFIEYTMPETGKVRLSVLDMLGQEIAVLVDATQSAGSYTVEFSAAGLATGVYIYKITVDGESRDFISTQRMVISH